MQKGDTKKKKKKFFNRRNLKTLNFIYTLWNRNIFIQLFFQSNSFLNLISIITCFCFNHFYIMTFLFKLYFTVLPVVKQEFEKELKRKFLAEKHFPQFHKIPQMVHNFLSGT